LGLQQRIRTIPDLVQDEVDPAQRAYGGDFGHSLERLDAALHLACFRRLGTKAIDEPVQVRNARLPRGSFALGLHLALGAKALELAVASGIARKLAGIEMQRC